MLRQWTAGQRWYATRREKLEACDGSGRQQTPDTQVDPGYLGLGGCVMLSALGGAGGQSDSSTAKQAGQQAQQEEWDGYPHRYLEQQSRLVLSAICT